MKGRNKFLPSARIYLLAGGIRQIILSVVCFVYADDFMAPIFRFVYEMPPGSNVMSMYIWTVLFGIVGLTLLYSVVEGKESAARLGLIASVALTSCWATGFFIEIFHRFEYVSPAIPIVWAITWFALAVKDASMLRTAMVDHSGGKIS